MRNPAERPLCSVDEDGGAIRHRQKRRFLWLLPVFFVAAGTVRRNAELHFVPHPQESRSGQPVLSFAADGTACLAWPMFLDGEIRVAVKTGRGEDWSPVTWPDPSPGAQSDPQWASGPAPPKDPNLVYSAYSAGRWTVRHSYCPSGRWSPPVELGEGIRPTAASTGKAIWAAWEDDGRIAIRRKTAGSWEEETILLSPDLSLGESLSDPRLASGPGGEVWLAWTASRRGYQSVRLKRIEAPGAPELTVDDGVGINRDPSISVDAEGRVWIVYESLARRSDSVLGSIEATQPIYILDRTYRVEFPSRVLSVTDGQRWWSPPLSQAPAAGLLPSLFCSSRGAVWLASRSFVGFERPFRHFSPIFESLAVDGWSHHEFPGGEGPCYKAPVALAEDPAGTVWSVWAQHNREVKAANETPSWTHLDGPDRIVMAPLPERPGGRPAALLRFVKNEPAPPPAFSDPQYSVTLGGRSLKVFFGDLHQHSEFSGCGRMNGRVDQNQPYTRHVRGLDFMCTIDHGEHLNEHTWRWTQLTSSQNDRPGRFVVFTGFEWTSEFDGGGNLFRGHYNSIYRDIENRSRRFSASDPATNTPLELWTALKQVAGGAARVLTFPHHPSRRMAWVSWNYYDPEMVPLIEIAQARGSYEYEGCLQGLDVANDATRVRGHYIHDGLERGFRWGFIGAGDHGGRQLGAIFAERLDRASLFEGLRLRRTYATSGEKMLLDIRINDHFMGEEFRLEEGSRDIQVTAVGTVPLVQVDLFRNGRVVRQWNPDSLQMQRSVRDDEPLTRRENYYYLRALQRDGGQAWTSPVWLIDSSVDGEFCFQVGGDELQVLYPGQETDVSVLMHNETAQLVQGTVRLRIPADWAFRESNGIPVICQAGGWRQAVFHVTVPPSSLTEPGLPEVVAVMEFPDGRTISSPLFVVASPFALSREEKAVLKDARKEIPASRFAEFLSEMVEAWRKEK